jgi:hypothetical protein
VQPFLDWLKDHPGALWLAGVSLILMVAGAIGAAVAVVRIPADYFTRAKPRKVGAAKIARNILGWLLVVAGAVMIVLPGPGAVALLAGLVLVDFPGRAAALRWLITRGSILKGMNNLRKRHGKPPLKIEKHTAKPRKRNPTKLAHA